MITSPSDTKMCTHHLSSKIFNTVPYPLNILWSGAIYNVLIWMSVSCFRWSNHRNDRFVQANGLGRCPNFVVIRISLWGESWNAETAGKVITSQRDIHVKSCSSISFLWPVEHTRKGVSPFFQKSINRRLTKGMQISLKMYFVTACMRS